MPDRNSDPATRASQKGVFATDLDAELERLYSDHVAVQYSSSRVGACQQ
jgi:hypothetical protein